MPEGTSSILGARSVETSHRRLADMLKPGLAVLDVGCGNGAITAGIARMVQPAGHAVGVDVNRRLIEEARQMYGHIPGLSFHEKDAYALGYDSVFHITTAARVLQWLVAPGDMLSQMIRATVPGGKVLVLDYNHDKLRWQPTPPAPVTEFYEAFLHWRADAGMDNGIADNLGDMFQQAGLRDVTVTPQHEQVQRGDAHFEQSINVWAAVMASRGAQMVSDGFISEQKRARAETAYRRWARDEATSQFMYLLAAEGTKGHTRLH